MVYRPNDLWPYMLVHTLMLIATHFSLLFWYSQSNLLFLSLQWHISAVWVTIAYSIVTLTYDRQGFDLLLHPLERTAFVSGFLLSFEHLTCYCLSFVLTVSAIFMTLSTWQCVLAGCSGCCRRWWASERTRRWCLLRQRDELTTWHTDWSVLGMFTLS